jgi:hypothetical protein
MLGQGRTQVFKAVGVDVESWLKLGVARHGRTELRIAANIVDVVHGDGLEAALVLLIEPVRSDPLAMHHDIVLDDGLEPVNLNLLRELSQFEARQIVRVPSWEHHIFALRELRHGVLRVYGNKDGAEADSRGSAITLKKPPNELIEKATLARQTFKTIA